MNDSEIIYNSIINLPIQVVNKIEKSEINDLILKFRECDETVLINQENIYFFDNPDFFIEFKDSILAVEHFMIDSSKLTRKGYKYKSKYSEQYFKEAHSDLNTEKKFSISKHSSIVSTDLKYEYLFDNFISIFNKHYQNIERYKKNIRNKIGNTEKEIVILFFVEYSILIPSTIYFNERVRAIFPNNDIRFYEFLEDKNEIEGLIINNSRKNSTELINRYISLSGIEQGEYEIDNRNVFDLSKTFIHNHKNPHFISTMINIKDKS